MEDSYSQYRRLPRRRRGIGRSFIAGFMGGLFVLGISALLIYANRGFVFDYLASGYIEEDFGSRGFFSEESAIVEIVDKANPAVVSIIITKDVPIYENFLERGPFGFLIPQQRQRGTEEKEVGGGSGFIVSGDGLVVTNKHVVADEEAKYTLFTQNGKSYDIEIVDIDPFFDLAILQIQAEEEFPFLSFGESSDLRLGQTVIAIGNALGEFRNSVSVGVVSGLSRSVVAGTNTGDSELLDEVIQTDAAINPGNSGGPLLNTDGDVIGINVAVASGSENIGFALPSDLAMEAVLSVEEDGHIIRPYLGVRFVEINKQVENLAELPIPYGALLSPSEFGPAIVPGSPAEKAGLKEGDIIIEVEGESLEGKSLSSLIRKQKVGQTIEVLIIRDEKEMKIDIKLEEVPQELS